MYAHKLTPYFSRPSVVNFLGGHLKILTSAIITEKDHIASNSTSPSCQSDQTLKLSHCHTMTAF